MSDVDFNILAIVCYEKDPLKLQIIMDFTAAFLLASPLALKITSVSGRKDISDYFKDFLNNKFNAGLDHASPLRCYVCKKISDYALEKLNTVSGKLVTASESDLETCVQLTLDFEAFVHAPKQRRSGTYHFIKFIIRINFSNLAEAIRSKMQELIKARTVWLWFDEKYTSLTMSTRETETAKGVNAVYTPDEYRGRGYATALVTAVVQILLQMKPNVFLFADLTNPISNKVYTNIGFEAVEDSVRWQC
jgi:predicted GNAT family acetyltransferase